MNQAIPRNKQVSYSTRFKGLYEETYWGGHSPLDEEEEKQLCINRDLMAEQYNLKKFHYYYSKFPKKYYRHLIIADLTEVERMISFIRYKDDGEPHYHKPSYVKEKMKEWIENHSNIMKHKDHVEYYTDINKNIVSVFSKYVSEDNTDLLELIEKSGYKEIKPIYGLDQRTFIKVIFLK
jgi:hypothetical protein